MSQTIQAIYENGVLRPLEKLTLGEHQQVQIILGPPAAETERQKASNRDETQWAKMVGEPGHSPSVVVPITAFEPEPFELIRSIPVVVQQTDDGYLATFFDANIGITGDTNEEAVANLRLLLVDVFEELEAEEAQLGPQMVRQLAVLRSFMKRRK
jgi:predicted DNA-binding antitoxin AbrB/MazE fold protein